jgi:dinuclear metal center YbgI/SA1388 family protein
MSMKMSELIAEIEIIAPRELEEDWDNCGMQINMGNSEVNRVLVALEITKGVISEAMDKNIDFIITHHPLLFDKIDVVDNNDIKGNYMIDLIKRGISVYSAHTTFDEAFGGNNEYLADRIGLSRVRKMKNKKPVVKAYAREHVVGRMGNFAESITMEATCRLVENALGVKGELKTVGDPDKIIRTVGLCAGSGSDSMKAAIKNGCDLFITGDIRHHEAQVAKESGLCVIDAGHYGTEKIFTENFADKLRKNVGSKIQIIESEVNSNPFNNPI